MSRLDAVWSHFGSRGRRWDDFWQTAVSELYGTGSIVLSVSLTGTGAKTAASDGSLTPVATLAGSGAKTAASGGSLTFSVALDGAGDAGGAGAGLLAVAPDIMGTGRKGAVGDGLLDLAWTASGTGTHAEGDARFGGGSLELTLYLAGAGKRTSEPLPRPLRYGRRVRLRRRHAEGSGELVLDVTLNGSGIAVDDEDWLLDDVFLVDLAAQAA